MPTLLTTQSPCGVIGNGATPPLSTARESVFSEAAQRNDGPVSVFQRLAFRLRVARATPIGLMIFGSIAARPMIDNAMRNILGEASWPVLWIEGAACHGAPLAGVQAFALREGPVTPVVLGGRVVASCYKVGGMSLCWTGGALPDDPGAARDVQTTQAFRALERALLAAGFELGDLVRTWCYTRDLPAWRDAFNRARSALYSEVHFHTGAPPASTGISASNTAGSALVLAGLAVRPGPDGRGARVISSPLQCPAPGCGSTFSRAMELQLGGSRRLLISGTASIEPGGATAWKGELNSQIWLTMRVISAILGSRGMNLSDINRSIAYFKSPDSVHAFENWCHDHRVINLPCIQLHCDMSRDDLLFELEADAETMMPAPQTK